MLIEWADGWLGRWVDICMGKKGRWVHGWLSGWIDGKAAGLLSGWMVGG